MANSDKDILITPATNTGDSPEIKFVGDSNSPVYIRVTDNNDISIESDTDVMLSISREERDGSFSINDKSGMSVMSVTQEGIVRVSSGFARSGYVLIDSTEGSEYVFRLTPYIIPNNVSWINVEYTSSTYFRFPEAYEQPGREITIRSNSNVYSDQSNIIRLSDNSSDSPDTLIHGASYYYSKLVSDGRYWVVMESNYR